MKNSKINRAVTLALTGAALSAGGISSAAAAGAFVGTTMYNLYNVQTSAVATDYNPGTGEKDGGTDGWVWGGASFPVGTSTSPGFVGVNGSSTPSTSPSFFGSSAPAFHGASIVNWAVQFTDPVQGSSVQVSQADAFSRYGVYPLMDTARGAWSDANNGTGAAGWRHNTDFGLFQSNVDTQVKLKAEGVNLPGTNFGFTIFKGMDSGTSYNHHNSWNAGNNTAGVTASSLVAGGTSFTTADVVAYSVGGATPSNINELIFTAQANQVYTIVLGGYKNGAWSVTADGYKVTVTAETAVVPIPAAAWLFGSALAGLGILGRRKGKTDA